MWPALVAAVVAFAVPSPPRATIAAPPGSAVPTGAIVTGVARDATAENSQRKLVIDPRGVLYLAYVRPVDRVDQIFLATSSDRGRTWRHTQVTRSPSPARLPSLAIFPDGSLRLVWTEYVPIGRVKYRSLRDGRWDEEMVLSQPGIYAGVPAVASVREQPHVLWYGIRPETPREPTRHGSTYEILATAGNGGRWTAPLVISPGVPDSINPSMDSLDGGRLQGAWFQFDARAYQVRTARFDGTWSRPRSLSTGPVDHMRVALAADGREVYLVWEESTPTTSVMYQRLDGGAAVRLSGSERASDPVVAASGGRVVAVWSEGGSIMLRPMRPSGSNRAVGTGRSPVVAVYRNTAYVVWVVATGSVPELRFAAVRLP